MSDAMDPCCYIRRTPLRPYLGPVGKWRAIWLKDETQQETGAFKFRGNIHKLASLPKGQHVVTASTGNHAAALAAAAQYYDLKATVFVPTSTPATKRSRVEASGAGLVVVPADYDKCEQEARSYALRARASFVSSFDDHDIIEGHRSMLREVDAELPGFTHVFCPVGGGGLLTACVRQWSGTKVITGVECEQAPAMARSLAQGSRVQLSATGIGAEGLMVRAIGRIAFEECRRAAPRIVTESIESIYDALAMLWHESGIRAEGAAAASLAAALHHPVSGAVAVCIISGGNIDASSFNAAIARGRGG